MPWDRTGHENRYRGHVELDAGADVIDKIGKLVDAVNVVQPFEQSSGSLRDAALATGRVKPMVGYKCHFTDAFRGIPLVASTATGQGQGGENAR